MLRAGRYDIPLDSGRVLEFTGKVWADDAKTTPFDFSGFDPIFLIGSDSVVRWALSDSASQYGVVTLGGASGEFSVRVEADVTALINRPVFSYNFNVDDGNGPYGVLSGGFVCIDSGVGAGAGVLPS